MWKVRLFAKGSLLKRRVWCGDQEWDPDGTITRREGSTIWPAWPGAAKGPAATAATPLADVRDYWSAVGTRLRDSAKWTAAVLGAALATLIGTSPLSGMRNNTPSAAAIALGAAGLVLLGCTLFLVVQVMRPKSISFTDIQVSGTGAGRLGSPQSAAALEGDSRIPAGPVPAMRGEVPDRAAAVHDS